MTEPSRPDADVAEPPQVDHPALAAALEEIRDLDARPLPEHHDRLRSVHETMHAVLNPTTD